MAMQSIEHHPLTAVYHADVHATFTSNDSARAAAIESDESELKRTSVDHPHNLNGYHRLCALAKNNDNWMMVDQHVVDVMHGIANLGKLVFGLLSNTRLGELDDARHELEVKRRVPGPRTCPLVDHKGERRSSPPWVFTSEQRAAFNVACSSLRLPVGNGYLPEFFSSTASIKCADWLMFLGPIGVYLFITAGSHLEDEVLSLLCDCCWWVHRLTRKEIRFDQLDDLELQGHELMTRFELVFPLRSNSIARHYLQHAVCSIRLHGPIFTQWM
jgi:hypothetical protein